MVYLAVDKDDQEIICKGLPERNESKWIAPCYQVLNYIELPKGSIAKLIGRELTWEDEPYKLE